MGQVYDPILKRVITDVEADALNAQRRAHAVDLEGGMGSDSLRNLKPPIPADGVRVDLDGAWGSLGFHGPQEGQDLALSVPPMAEEDAASIMQAFPQFAGLLAQFFPGGKLASVAVPAVAAMAQQGMSGEGIDPLDAAIEGIQGFIANRFGAGTGAIGSKGAEKVTRALGFGADQSDAAVKKMTDLAIREGAEMTPEGAAAIRAAGTTPTVTSKTHAALADQLDTARRASERAPNRITFWPQEAAANWLRKPERQLAIGRRMANPVAGVSTQSHLAPAVEAAIRLKLMEMAANEQPRMQSSRGPVRRPVR